MISVNQKWEVVSRLPNGGPDQSSSSGRVWLGAPASGGLDGARDDPVADKDGRYYSLQSLSPLAKGL